MKNLITITGGAGSGKTQALVQIANSARQCNDRVMLLHGGSTAPGIQQMIGTSKPAIVMIDEISEPMTLSWVYALAYANPEVRFYVATSRDLRDELMEARRLLTEAMPHVVASPDPVRGGFIDEVNELMDRGV